MTTPAQIMDSAGLITPFTKTFGEPKSKSKNNTKINLVIKTDQPLTNLNKVKPLSSFTAYKQATLNYNGTYELIVYVDHNKGHISPRENDVQYTVTTTQLFEDFAYQIKNDFMSFYIHKHPLSDPLSDDEKPYIFDGDIYYSPSKKYFRKESEGLSVNDLSDIFKRYKSEYSTNNSIIKQMFKWCIDIKRCGDSLQHVILEDTVQDNSNGIRRLTTKNGKVKYPLLSNIYILTFDYLSAAYGVYKHGRVIAKVGGPSSQSYYLFDNV